MCFFGISANQRRQCGLVCPSGLGKGSIRLATQGRERKLMHAVSSLMLLRIEGMYSTGIVVTSVRRDRRQPKQYCSVHSTLAAAPSDAAMPILDRGDLAEQLTSHLSEARNLPKSFDASFEEALSCSDHAQETAERACVGKLAFVLDCSRVCLSLSQGFVQGKLSLLVLPPQVQLVKSDDRVGGFDRV